MRHRNTIAVVVVIALALSTSARAQTAMFEDLVVSTVYNNGSTFASNGITFDVGDFTYSGGGTTNSGFTSVINPNAAGAGNGMNVNNVNLDVTLPSAASAVGFAYAEFGGNVNLTINGTLFNSDDFFANDGFSNSDYSISVSNVSNSGFVTVSGAITQFSFGGQELSIDDVRVVLVPEPATAVLGTLALAGVILAARRR